METEYTKMITMNRYTCDICGEEIEITARYVCEICGRDACEDHVDQSMDLTYCNVCAESYKKYTAAINKNKEFYGSLEKSGRKEIIAEWKRESLGEERLVFEKPVSKNYMRVFNIVRHEEETEE